MLGGHSQSEQPDAELLELFKGCRNHIEEKAGHKYNTFEVVGFTKQVVAGMIYRVHIRVAHEAHEHIWVQIFKPLPHTNLPAEVQLVQMTAF